LGALTAWSEKLILHIPSVKTNHPKDGKEGNDLYIKEKSPGGARVYEKEKHIYGDRSNKLSG
jgi:hypothetical protein